MPRASTLLMIFAAAIFALALGVYFGGGQIKSTPKTTTSIAEGIEKAAIDRLFASQWHDADETPINFAQWRGKTLVINFWATWCPPCREEMPGFARLQTKYATSGTPSDLQNGVQFIGIALDSAENVRDFSKRSPINYPLLMGDAQGSDFARALGNPRLALPYTLLIAPNGRAHLTRLGGISEQELDALLRQMTGT